MTATSSRQEAWTRGRIGIAVLWVPISPIISEWSRKRKRSSRGEAGTASAFPMIGVLLLWKFISRRLLLGRYVSVSHARRRRGGERDATSHAGPSLEKFTGRAQAPRRRATGRSGRVERPTVASVRRLYNIIRENRAGPPGLLHRSVSGADLST